MVRTSFDGGLGDDIICGGSGDDRLAGGGGNDRIYGDGGDDYFIEGAGNDRIVGGSGNDYLSYFTSSVGIRVRNGNTIDGVGHDTADVETIEGTAKADVMRGGSGDDDLRGLAGKDLIVGGAGDDVLSASGGTIRGGPGNDFIDASGTVTAYFGGGVNGSAIGGGRPTLVGGPAQDEFTFRTRKTNATVRGGGGDNQIVFLGVRKSIRANISKGRATWSGGSLKFQGINTLIGSNRADVLIGSSGSDVLYGRAGKDVLRGLGGNDLITGQGGRDVADGGRGLDYCYAERRRNCEG